MVDVVKSKVVDCSEFDSIIVACFSLLSRESSYEVWLIRRQTNIVAHKLRATNSYASSIFAYDNPSFISNILIHDCNDFILVNK